MEKTAKQVVWITGASSGIGEALVKEYAKTGAHLLLSARNEEKLVAIRNSFGADIRERIAVLPLDLADSALLANKCREAIDLFGQVDVLINNGGISQRSITQETKMDVYRKLMEVNYFGNISLAKGLLPHFISRRGGQIVVISSLVGKFGSPYRSGYAASKHALHGFYDSLRAELTGSGISVTMICPGFIRTDVSVNALTGDGTPLQQMDKAQAKGMSPDKCAKKIIKAATKKQREVYIGGKEVLGVYLKRFFPNLFARMLPRASVR